MRIRARSRFFHDKNQGWAICQTGKEILPQKRRTLNTKRDIGHQLEVIKKKPYRNATFYLRLVLNEFAFLEGMINRGADQAGRMLLFAIGLRGDGDGFRDSPQLFSNYTLERNLAEKNGNLRLMQFFLLHLCRIGERTDRGYVGGEINLHGKQLIAARPTGGGRNR